MKKKFNTTFLWLLISIAISYFSFNSLLRPGFFPMHDDMQAMRTLQMDKCIKDGQIPCRWVPDMGYGYGYPQFNYYPPLPYYVMEGAHLLGYSFLGSVKAGFILSFILSAASMFLLGKSLFGNFGGFISSIFYIYAPYRATNVYNRGAVGEFWALVFLPLIFWAILEIVRKGKTKYILYLALSFAGLLITHLITSLIFSPIALLWGLFLLWQFNKPKRLKKLATGTLWGCLMAGFFIIPVVLEKKYAHTETLTMGFFNYLAHFVSIKQLFLSTNWGFGSTEIGPYDDFTFSIGIAHWLFGLLALLIAWLYRKKNSLILNSSLILSFITLGALFMTHQKSVGIWNAVPTLSYLQFPWRFLTIAMFSISLLVGSIPFAIQNIRSKKWVTMLMTISVFFLNVFYFYPRLWYNITDADKFTGESWEKQLTISIYDYLPIYAQMPPNQKAPNEPEVLSGEATVVSGEKGTNWQKWNVDVSSDSASIRLPLYDFPGWRVWVNSKEVPINHDNILGLITFPVGKGQNNIEARLTDTPVRQVGNTASVLSLMAIPIYLTKKKRSKK